MAAAGGAASGAGGFDRTQTELLKLQDSGHVLGRHKVSRVVVAIARESLESGATPYEKVPDAEVREMLRSFRELRPDASGPIDAILARIKAPQTPSASKRLPKDVIGEIGAILGAKEVQERFIEAGEEDNAEVLQFLWQNFQDQLDDATIQKVFNGAVERGRTHVLRWFGDIPELLNRLGNDKIRQAFRSVLADTPWTLGALKGFAHPAIVPRLDPFWIRMMFTSAANVDKRETVKWFCNTPIFAAHLDTGPDDDLIRNTFQYAAEFGRLPIVKEIHAHFAACLNMRTIRESLYRAKQNGHTDMVQWLRTTFRELEFQG